MAFDVRWDTDPRYGTILAGIVGANRFGQEQQARDRQLAQENARLAEAARRTDINAALRAQSLYDQNNRYYAGLGAAADNQEADRLAQLANNAMLQDARLQEAAIQQYGQAARLGQQQDYDWSNRSAVATEAAINDEFKRLRKLKLTPEGTRMLNQLSSKYQAVRSGRADRRPAQYQSLLGQVQNDVAEAGIDGYQEETPDPTQMFAQSAVPLDGQQIVPGQPLPPGRYQYVNGMRNGVPTWANTFVPPRTRQEFEAYMDTYRLPNGGYFIPDDKGGGKYIDTAPKGSTGGFSEKELHNSLDKDFSRARDELIEEAQLTTPMVRDPASGKMVPGEVTMPTNAEIWERAKLNRNRVEQELYRHNNPNYDDSVPHLGIPSGGQSGEPTIITNAAGERARVNADGSVTLLP